MSATRSISVALLLSAGCAFDPAGIPVSGVDASDPEVSVVEGGQILDATSDVALDATGPGDAVHDVAPDWPAWDAGPGPDAWRDGPVDAPPTPDIVAPCPPTCPIACLPGSATCPLPSNISAGQLPAPCAAVTVPQGAVWRLCSNTSSSCRIVSGTDCNAAPTCAGSAVNQTTAVGGTTIPACAFAIVDLTVETGATLQVRGESPALLVVKGAATIAGLVDASAQGRYGGAGGGDGGKVATSGKGASGTGPVPGAGGQTCDCQTSEDNYDDCGGGGGGFSTVGGAGGLEGGKFCSSGPEPLGGTSYGTDALVPLLGGAGGGSGDVGNAAGAVPGDGGGGGGAIQISASSIDLTGAILANGGPGGGGASSNNTYPGGGGGGGSGGGILLEATTFGGTGWTMAAGGGGGGGGDDCSAGDGKQDKLVSGNEQAPTGGAGCNSGGDGGTGAYKTPPGSAGAGQNAGIWEGPGGGGGGAGRLRFNTIAAAVACPPAGLKTSASVSCGTMTVKAP